MSGKVKILVVEDDSAVNQLLCKRLERESFEAQGFITGRELLNSLEMGVKADLMLLDFKLNDLDALQIVQKIKKLNRFVPFIVCTGVGSESIAVQMMKEGARDYLVKDRAFLEVLIPTVNKVLGEINIEKELEAARQKLTYQNAILSAVHELSLDGIVVVDEADTIVSVNKRFCELWDDNSFAPGMSANEMFEKVSVKLTKPNKFLTSLENIKSIVSPIPRKHQDLELTSGDFYELYSTPMKTEKTETFGRVWYFRDISLHQKAKANMESARKAAEKAENLKAEFLANFSHEVRTPMNSLSGFLELLAVSNLDEVQKDYLNSVKLSCDNLTRLINNTLDLSKLEAGAMFLDDQLFDIPQLLSEAAIVVDSLRKESVELKVNVKEDLQPVCGDSVKLQQVIINLLSNALKFTDSGAVTLSCEMLSENEFCFVVSDTGTGIDPAKQEEIFEAFRQESASTQNVRGGTGLGLSISARIVRLLGGELKVESEVGKGSKFFFKIPFKSIEAI